MVARDSWKMNANDDLKKRIARANRIAYLEGLREDKGNEIAGHISVRTGSTLLMPGHMHDFGEGPTRHYV